MNIILNYLLHGSTISFQRHERINKDRYHKLLVGEGKGNGLISRNN